VHYQFVARAGRQTAVAGEFFVLNFVTYWW
jgi:hypothetical protein